MDSIDARPDAATKASAFIAELTELSAKYGIALSGKPVLFVMQPEDFAFSYRMDNESNLSFG